MIFEDQRCLPIITDVIEAIADGTVTPRYNDTGWRFVGHHAL
jgi:hypothetical protein